MEATQELINAVDHLLLVALRLQREGVSGKAGARMQKRKRADD